LDRIDKRIVRELQKNARLTNQELSERVGLSPSPCLRRVRLLEEKGVLLGYTAIVDQSEYGLPITAFVSVRLEKQAEATIRAFEKGIAPLEEVLACYLVSGSHDYLLQVACRSLKDYERFIREKLTRIEGIGSLETNYAFGRVKYQPVFPAVE
jgi:DNA-binding Lrp family transcriptional regulator